MYIELYGNESQNENNLPGRVYLGLRHSTGSYFRDGNGTVKEFRQPLSLQYRTFEFNRFAITDTAQCTAAQLAGNGGYFYPAYTPNQNMASNINCHCSGLTSVVFTWKYKRFITCVRPESPEQWQFRLDAIFRFGV